MKVPNNLDLYHKNLDYGRRCRVLPREKQPFCGCAGCWWVVATSQNRTLSEAVTNLLLREDAKEDTVEISQEAKDRAELARLNEPGRKAAERTQHNSHLE